ncbi:ATP-dependent zinc metalloprotease FtsH [Pendulispora brunnea]|uniref:ATP-dependent zinc metalloprotease FtsH n=1 Tax=Pendulispora brunnea TaxID=2905690 RepID=A0ABZ2K5Z5_9BACT
MRRSVHDTALAGRAKRFKCDIDGSLHWPWLFFACDSTDEIDDAALEGQACRVLFHLHVMRKTLERLSSYRSLAIIVVMIFISLWFSYLDTSGAMMKRVPYSEFVAAVSDGRVERAEVASDRIVATVRDKENGPAEAIVTDRVPNVEERTLLDAMQSKGVVVTGIPQRSSPWATLLWTLAPFLFMIALFWGFSRMAAPGRGRPMSFGRSKAKLYDRSKEHPVTFADVAGVDEAKAELREVVGFLKEPEKYRAVGARMPKGVLLVGAPGTGKTLLAKAVAGESGVPFFSMSGSEFVEMFVGVGASRVRDLFEQAKERASCIIFIDELDAVGKARAGAAGFASNEEREQTLNQLLVEMDGFDSGSGLVIMAATNRPEILDRALLRAGRFDRQVVVDRPDVRGREAILQVHARKVLLDADVDLEVVAQRTPGMVGADLANVVNEAALASVRRSGKQVTFQDFEEAIDRIQLGLKKEGRVMTDHEKRRVAIHEAGHALVALSIEHADPVHRVTIIPRSIGALGATLQLPTEERYLLTRDELRDRICVLLGGRAAEELACDGISTGAQVDLERATETVRRMVCHFGMSDALGPLTFGHDAGGRFLPWRPEPVEGRNFSEETARIIDAEVKSIMTKEHARARSVLTTRRSALDSVAHELLTHETLQRAELEAILGRPKRESRPAQHPRTAASGA